MLSSDAAAAWLAVGSAVDQPRSVSDRRLSMSRRVTSSLSVCVLALLAGCGGDDKDYDAARRADTIEAYEQFVAEHPTGKHQASAAGRLEELRAERDLATARKSDDIATYDEFLAGHPKSTGAAAVRARVRELVAERAYRFKAGYKGKAGARRIVVQSTAAGLQVKAGSVAFLSRQGEDVEMTPRDARLSFTVEGFEFDRASFAMASRVTLEFKDGVVLPARLLMQDGGSGLQAAGIKAVYPDAVKSSEISIVVDPAIGSTAYGGLRFGSPAVVGTSEDGRVEVDREGITATDASGAVWVSRSLAADGFAPFVLVRR
jgi:hypothetical protein